MDLNVFVLFQSIAIMTLIIFQIVPFCPLGASSNWFLSLFDSIQVVFVTDLTHRTGLSDQA